MTRSAYGSGGHKAVAGSHGAALGKSRRIVTLPDESGTIAGPRNDKHEIFEGREGSAKLMARLVLGGRAGSDPPHEFVCPEG